jgi:hypothetical protein
MAKGTPVGDAKQREHESQTNLKFASITENLITLILDLDNMRL